jgi:hypothetical protein
MKRLLILALLLGCTACAPSYLWTHSRYSEAAWQADRYACERDTRMSYASFGSSVVGEVMAERFMARCLESKGYYRVKVD